MPALSQLTWGVFEVAASKEPSLPDAESQSRRKEQCDSETVQFLVIDCAIVVHAAHRSKTIVAGSGSVVRQPLRDTRRIWKCGALVSNLGGTARYKRLS